MKKLFALVGLAFCHIAYAQTDTVTVLAPQAFEEAMHTIKDVVILDVRTPGEFEKNRLADAINYNWNDPDFIQQVSFIDKSTPLLVYCLSGGRSGAAAKKLAASGYQHVYALAGGLLQWEASKLPVIESSAAATGMQKAEFDKLLETDKTVLVDFYAPWCKPCKVMEPYLHEIEKENAHVQLLRINIVENPGLAEAMEVHALPYIQVYKNKQLTWEKQGLATKTEIVQHL